MENLLISHRSICINAQFTKLQVSRTQDACGKHQSAVMAEQVGSPMYEFCLAIKNEAMAEGTTRFDVSDASSNNPAFVSIDGLQELSKFNIGSVEFDALAVCKDYGISWRRNLAFAPQRGKQRSSRSIGWEG